jgi:hypothetical protein
LKLKFEKIVFLPSGEGGGRFHVLILKGEKIWIR